VEGVEGEGRLGKRGPRGGEKGRGARKDSGRGRGVGNSRTKGEDVGGIGHYKVMCVSGESEKTRPTDGMGKDLKTIAWLLREMEGPS